MLNKSFKRPDIIRPPSEWKSYFLPLTGGCSNSSCTFCGYYGSKLRLRSVEEVKQEIDALAMFINYGIRLPAIPDIAYQVARGWDGEKLFLQDGDALIYPFPKLVEVLQYLNQKLPDLERVAIYATPQDILRRSRDELSQLKELKLGIFYMGVESGDSEVLEKIGKGVNYDQMVGAGRKAIEAGITLSATVILGLGGIEGSERHSLETARILSDIDPEYGGALTLTLIPGTPLYQQAQNGDFHPISPFRSLEELKIIVENSHFTNCFFSSVHASNYFSIRGTLPYDKEKMLGQLEAVLKAREPSLLRPEFLRGL